MAGRTAPSIGTPGPASKPAAAVLCGSLPEGSTARVGGTVSCVAYEALPVGHHTRSQQQQHTEARGNQQADANTRRSGTELQEAVQQGDGVSQRVNPHDDLDPAVRGSHGKQRAGNHPDRKSTRLNSSHL